MERFHSVCLVCLLEELKDKWCLILLSFTMWDCLHSESTFTVVVIVKWMNNWSASEIDGEMAVQSLVGRAPSFLPQSSVSLFSRCRPRSARYYQIFGREPEYPCALFCLQFLFGVFKCFVCYFLIFLLLQWYLWPIIEPAVTRFSLVQTTLNRSSSIVDRLRGGQKVQPD